MSGVIGRLFVKPTTAARTATIDNSSLNFAARTRATLRTQPPTNVGGAFHSYTIFTLMDFVRALTAGLAYLNVAIWH